MQGNNPAEQQQHARLVLPDKRDSSNSNSNSNSNSRLKKQHHQQRSRHEKEKVPADPIESVGTPICWISMI
jgi:hypothetical protein